MLSQKKCILQSRRNLAAARASLGEMARSADGSLKTVKGSLPSLVDGVASSLYGSTTSVDGLATSVDGSATSVDGSLSSVNVSASFLDESASSLDGSASFADGSASSLDQSSSSVDECRIPNDGSIHTNGMETTPANNKDCTTPKRGNGRLCRRTLVFPKETNSKSSMRNQSQCCTSSNLKLKRSASGTIKSYSRVDDTAINDHPVDSDEEKDKDGTKNPIAGNRKLLSIEAIQCIVRTGEQNAKIQE
jgi:uncharacterized phage infection (PIP) family protein YhgE